MTQLQLFKTLRLHRKLAEKRMIDLEKNKAAKWLMYIGAGVTFLYLMMIAILLALIANDLRTMSSIEFIACAIPITVTLDFFTRFIAQQTPAQIIKPYVLLPIPKYTCIDFFIGGQMLNWSNLVWFVLMVPFCLMSVVFSYGVWPCVALLVYFWLVELCVSQFYLIFRTLINSTMLWWLLLVPVVLLALLPGVDWAELVALNFKDFYDFEAFFLFFGKAGLAMEEGSLLPHLLILVLLGVLYFVNRRVQYSHIMAEVSRTEKVMTIENPSSMKFLDRMGELGFYLGLEIKTSMRNKNPRKSMIAGIAIVFLFSLLSTFSDVYDSPYMVNFWCIYNFAIFGSMTLTKVMCSEGNYIDGLMVRKENILQILRAKYYFNCLVLLLPMVLVMPTVISGKWSLLMVFSYAVFTAGFQYFLLFQLAVTNKTTVPLNTKFISKSGMENSAWQVAIEMICLFVPVVFVSILQAILGDTWSFIVMLAIGLFFIATHKLWLRNIYNRFMRRRYVNMEGFRASR